MGLKKVHGMIFESLYDSARKDELILLDDGMCRFHIRRDGQLTIHEIIVTRPGCGIGTRILALVRGIGRSKNCHSILAKCPADMPANQWYKAKGFAMYASEITPSGRKLNVWRLPI